MIVYTDFSPKSLFVWWKNQKKSIESFLPVWKTMFRWGKKWKWKINKFAWIGRVTEVLGCGLLYFLPFFGSRLLSFVDSMDLLEFEKSLFDYWKNERKRKKIRHAVFSVVFLFHRRNYAKIWEGLMRFKIVGSFLRFPVIKQIFVDFYESLKSLFGLWENGGNGKKKCGWYAFCSFAS